MQLSTRGRIAVAALFHLAREGTGGIDARHCPPVGLAEIAAAQDLNLAYLEQVFGRLRRGGLVRSVRGPGGGYCLTRPPSAISIGDVVRAVDSEGDPADPARPECPCRALWWELDRRIDAFLGAVSLADVVEGGKQGKGVLF